MYKLDIHETATLVRYAIRRGCPPLSVRPLRVFSAPALQQIPPHISTIHRIVCRSLMAYIGGLVTVFTIRFNARLCAVIARGARVSRSRRSLFVKTPSYTAKGHN
jgi:hypothetical protein